MGLLRPLERFVGVFQRLFRVFMPGQMIFFPVVRRRGSVRVRGKLVKFGSSLMRVIWHSNPQPSLIPLSALSHKGQAEGIAASNGSWNP